MSSILTIVNELESNHDGAALHLARQYRDEWFYIAAHLGLQVVDTQLKEYVAQHYNATNKMVLYRTISQKLQNRYWIHDTI